jgi:hypothetical protein
LHKYKKADCWCVYIEEKTIQNIPAVPFALMMGAILAVIGLIMGIIFALVFGSIMSMVPTGGLVDLTGFSILFGLGAIIIMPIGGFIGGLI